MAVIAIASSAGDIQLTPAQDRALQDMLTFAAQDGPGLFTLEGFAGVGKTTVVAQLIERLPRNVQIAVAAPTNKAVGVLQDKIGARFRDRVHFSSLHSLLGLRLTEREDGTQTCRRAGPSMINDYDVVIVDESSMVGRTLFEQVVSNQHSGRTIFVGDPAQLPPVNDGGKSPTFERVQRKALLTEVVRQQRGNPIIELSMRIRAAIESGERIQYTDIVGAVGEAGQDSLCIAGGGTRTAITWTLADRRAGHDTRIIAHRNATVIAANLEIHAALHGNEDPFVVGETVIAHEGFDAGTPGNRVLVHNSEEMTVQQVMRAQHPEHPGIDARRLLVERATGDLIELWVPACERLRYRAEQALWAQFNQLKQQRDAARARGEINSELDMHTSDASSAAWAFKRAFAPLRHSYAMTVHKSQGSTLHTAIVDLGDMARMRDPVEFNRALYVAVTRPMQNLALITP